MRILISASSKHGSTAEIADRIGEVMAARGLEVTVSPPEQVNGLDGYAAVVLGSAVYAGHWMPAAKDLADRVATEAIPHVWLFSSGPIGDPPKPEEDPVDVADIESATHAVDHAIFPGMLDKSKLNFGERAIIAAFHAPYGDFRRWDEVEHWASGIADKILTVVTM
jgi:menaquinone-dependent protoporphyrinogen oxidase